MTEKKAQKKVLVAGGSGQVGTELGRYMWPSHFSVQVATRSQLDITQQVQVDQMVDNFSPDYIINAAAYTAVDKAEDNRDQAMKINATSVQHLAAAADRVGAGLVHISTDYVFDGFKDRAEDDDWYSESDKPNPLNVYGESKLAGEEFALQANKAVVLRTSWVYSAHGHNFIHTMRRLADEGTDIRVVDDQYGCPTSAADIASVAAAVVQQDMRYPGLFHAASIEDASWWDLATEALFLSGYEVDVSKITTSDYPLPAKRPMDSRMSSAELASSYGLICPPWRESVAKVVAEMSEKVLL